MSTREITVAKEMADLVLKYLAKHPNSPISVIAEALNIPSTRAMQNRIRFMVKVGLVIPTGKIGGKGREKTLFSIAGPLKAMLSKNQNDSDEKARAYREKSNAVARAKSAKSRPARRAKQIEREEMPVQIAGEMLPGGGYVEKTATGRVYRLEAFRRPARDCIGDAAGGGRGAGSSLAGEYAISYPLR